MARRFLSLNDSAWRVGSVPQKPFGDVDDVGEVREWLSAKVPGDVRLDLLRAGKIPDPFVADNNEASQWIDARDWWYVRELDLEVEKGERAFVIFEGIDYQSAVFVDGRQLGRHVGMFSRQCYELPRSSHQLGVRVWGADALPKMELSNWTKIWRRIIAPLFTSPNQPFPDRYATLKCQMQFGWDFAPRLRTCGIWEDAQIVIARSVFLEDAWVKSELNHEQAQVTVTLALDSTVDQNVHVVYDLRGKNFSGSDQRFEIDLQLIRGKQSRPVEFTLQNVREWQPWDRGEPNLYEVEITVFRGASRKSPEFHLAPNEETNWGEQLDSFITTFGIRSFHLEKRGAQADPWTFVLNGKREFIRGANWVPLDAIPGRLTRAEYAARLMQARAANINFLRVWGGGLREKRAFYDLCDELGILVWQEFPFAGAILDRFPSDQSFMDFVRSECGAIVRSLRNHPSLVVWCGGNEFNTRGNHSIVETLRTVVAEHDGSRPLKPASPYRDESHNWRVWHRLANVRDYKKDNTPFLSEFGLQSVPDPDSLDKFLPPNASERLWEYHHAELKKLFRYSVPLSFEAPIKSTPLHSSSSGTEGMPRPTSAAIPNYQSLVASSQRAQANALQIAIEHMRRRKAIEAAGIAIWQLNDAWPAISWSVIDYYGVPKLAYHALKRAYSPVLASFDNAFEPRPVGSIVHGDLWMINDLRSSFTNAQLSATLNGVEIFSQHVSVEPDSAIRIGRLDVPLVDGRNDLQLILKWGPAPLCENVYDLNYCDRGEINPLIAWYVSLGNKLMR